MMISARFRELLSEGNNLEWEKLDLADLTIYPKNGPYFDVFLAHAGGCNPAWPYS